MKKFLSNISPFMLLVIPFFVALILVAKQPQSDVTQERIQLNASFISLPDIHVFNVLLW
ncbi:hypothetical protein [Parapedobacter sp. 10938]|uniref:hypothetical protein n=1 Tax=Parapedobacter flavus TaxID=3110225 RepID=UPI002DBE983E|nr:hypothetical protein [Parapedobacter sp. 10938]MEC3881584.1 hypothetical protein [Parapedobacter sp. 10938]